MLTFYRVTLDILLYFYVYVSVLSSHLLSDCMIEKKYYCFRKINVTLNSSFHEPYLKRLISTDTFIFILT